MLRGALVLVLAAIFEAGVHSLEAPIPGYGVDPLSWEVEPSPGRPAVTLTGTVQEVHARLLEINPNYEVEFGSIVHTKEDPAVTPASAKLAKRSLAKRDDLKCNNWPRCGSPFIRQGIEYLRKVGGKPSLGPGPGKCSRNKFTKVLPSFNNIADGAQVILNGCEDKSKSSVSGQLFHSDKWNVIVRYDQNNC
ncbi:MAG: hypothetical protein M1816_005253 [Peltula sp. TS41687]|nr:MAG: hypothetical protein M1816_005253 [Peltula sp. TS41687]